MGRVGCGNKARPAPVARQACSPTLHVKMPEPSPCSTAEPPLGSSTSSGDAHTTTTKPRLRGSRRIICTYRHTRGGPSHNQQTTLAFAAKTSESVGPRQLCRLPSTTESIAEIIDTTLTYKMKRASRRRRVAYRPWTRLRGVHHQPGPARYQFPNETRPFGPNAVAMSTDTKPTGKSTRTCKRALEVVNMDLPRALISLSRRANPITAYLRTGCAQTHHLSPEERPRRRALGCPHPRTRKFTHVIYPREQHILFYDHPDARPDLARTKHAIPEERALVRPQHALLARLQCFASQHSAASWPLKLRASAM